MRSNRMLAVLLLAPLMASGDATIANVATPAIRADLGASGAALELVVGAYFVAFAVLLITGARLGHTHGYRRLFLAGAGVFGAGSLFGGLAPDPWLLIAARVGQGAGAALMLPQALSGIQLHFDGDARARAIGRYSLALSGGAVIGQILGGVLVSAGGSWRPIFLVNVPICVAAIVAGRRVLPPDEARGSARIDVRGVATLSAAILLIVAPLTLGRGEGWPAWTWICLAAAPAALAVFFRSQRLIDVRALRPPPVLLSLLALMAATGTYFALLFTLAQYVQRGLGHSALVSGLTLVPWVAAFGVGGQLAHRRPARALSACGYLLLTADYLSIGLLRPGGALFIVLLGFGGLGLGIGFAALLGHLTSSVAPRHAAEISGLSTTTTQIGGAIGVAAAGGLYLGLAPDGPRHAFAVTALALAAAAAFAAVAAFMATLRSP
jgi:predicted MFS family arabinose efflux permease